MQLPTSQELEILRKGLRKRASRLTLEDEKSFNPYDYSGVKNSSVTIE